MTETVETLNGLLATGGIALFLAGTVLVVDLYTSRTFQKLIEVWGLLVAYFVTLSGLLMTVLYSEVFGFVPCGLCWLGRVFLYPQVFLLAVALFYKDKTVARYGITLSIPGLLVGLYQHYLQMGGSEFITCPSSGGDCGKRILFEYGFVTFPLMSVMLFAFLIALYIYILKTRTT